MLYNYITMHGAKRHKIPTQSSIRYVLTLSSISLSTISKSAIFSGFAPYAVITSLPRYFFHFHSIIKFKFSAGFISLSQFSQFSALPNQFVYLKSPTQGSCCSGYILYELSNSRILETYKSLESIVSVSIFCVDRAHVLARLPVKGVLKMFISFVDSEINSELTEGLNADKLKENGKRQVVCSSVHCTLYTEKL
jgi:hypothetical protein